MSGAVVELDVEDLYRKHYRDVFRVALRLVGGQHQAAEDVTHDVFVRLLRWIRLGGRFEDRGRPPAALLHTMARNLALDWRKHGQRREHLVQTTPGEEEALPAAAADTGPEDAAVTLVQQAAWRQQLERALVTLPQRQREVLHLTYVELLPQADVARKLGCSVGAVKAATYRAMQALRADPGVCELGDEFDC